MRYVIYHRDSTLFFRTWLARNHLPTKGLGSPYYESEAAAKAALTRVSKVLTKDIEGFKGRFAIAPAEDFHRAIEKKEVRHGIVGSAGKEFTVGVNEPWTSGPWSETYWSS